MPAGGIAASGPRTAVAACSRGRSARVAASGEGIRTTIVPCRSIRMGGLDCAGVIIAPSSIGFGQRKDHTERHVGAQQEVFIPIVFSWPPRTPIAILSGLSILQRFA